MDIILAVLKHALSITFFVFVMMVLVEYLNVISQGRWELYFCRQRGLAQYFWAALLGVLPGCLGAFAAVTLYTHRMFSIGAIITTMIATSGDESFVMFALFPGSALQLSIILFFIAPLIGWLVDRIIIREPLLLDRGSCEKMVVHHAEEMPVFPGWQSIGNSLKKVSSSRTILALGLLLFIFLLVIGVMGPPVWNWKRITFVIIGLAGLWMILSSSEHFINDHIWKHVAKEHLPQLFGWTFAALLLVHFITDHLELSALIQESRYKVMMLSALVGIIPSSGPHLFFVTLFSEGLIPFGTLLVSSIVQDGHAMLPLLAFSRLDFLKVKGINFLVGLAFGVLWLALANLW